MPWSTQDQARITGCESQLELTQVKKNQPRFDQ